MGRTINWKIRPRQEPDWDAEPVFCKGSPPRGAGDTCSCNGCRGCDFQYNENYQNAHIGQPTMDMWLCAPGGHVTGCTCDIDWECVYGRHRRICFTYDRS